GIGPSWLAQALVIGRARSITQSRRTPGRASRHPAGHAQHQPATWPLWGHGSVRSIPEPVELRRASVAGTSAWPARIDPFLHTPQRSDRAARTHDQARLARRRLVVRGPRALQ